MKYHYNPSTGAVGVCRADASKPESRGCLFQLSGEEHYQTKGEAAAAFEKSQEQIPDAAVKSDKIVSGDQLEYFKNSKLLDDERKPIAFYHGSPESFDSFDPRRLGRGNDSWGNGFYFAESRETADAYSEGGTTREFYLNLTNPIILDGRKERCMDSVRFSSTQTAAIVSGHPDLTLQPSDPDRMNPLGDYSESFWERKEHTDQQLKEIRDQVIKDYFSNADWATLENFYGRENGEDYLRTVSEVTGHDGVVVNFGEDGRFAIAWNPTQMKLSSNLNPTSSGEIAG